MAFRIEFKKIPGLSEYEIYPAGIVFHKSKITQRKRIFPDKNGFYKLVSDTGKIATFSVKDMRAFYPPVGTEIPILADSKIKYTNLQNCISYEEAQMCRKLYSEGKSIVSICEQLKINEFPMFCALYYIEQKLRKGDTEYTPLVNQFYPPLGHPKNVNGFNGAPYEHELEKNEGSEKFIQKLDIFEYNELVFGNL